MKVMMPYILSLSVLFIPGLVLAEEVVAPQAGATQPAPAVKRVRPMFPLYPPSEEIQALNEKEREERQQTWLAELDTFRLAHKKRLTVPLAANGIGQVRVRPGSDSDSDFLDRRLRAGPKWLTGPLGLRKPCESGSASSLDVTQILIVLEDVCKVIERLAAPPPSPSGYTLEVSLKEPLGGVSVVIWRAATLDEVLTIVRLVQEGQIEAAIVQAHRPKDEPEPDSKPIKFALESCQTCPIVEWVFRVSGKK